MQKTCVDAHHKHCPECRKSASPLRSDVKRLVSHSFTDSELQEMWLSCVPLSVQVRLVLNSVGFKFEDDGKPSLIINHEPKPLGIMKSWREEESMTTHYQQEITVG